MQREKMQIKAVRFMFTCPHCNSLNTAEHNHLPIIDKYGETEAVFYYYTTCDQCKKKVTVTKDIYADLQIDIVEQKEPVKPEIISQEERAELYKKQETAHVGDSLVAFVPRDFVCYCCHKDLLDTPDKIKEARAGQLIVHCHRCHRSFCD